jgi:outer membrane autotransporter protein
MDADTTLGLLYTGVDFVVNPQLLVGLLFQHDSLRQTSKAQSNDIKGKGWMTGPYATVRLSEHLFWQSRIAAGRSTVDVLPDLTYTNTFDTKHWLATTSITGSWQLESWRIEPTISLSHIEDKSDAYVDYYGIAIPRMTTKMTEASAGPEFVYVIHNKDGSSLEPRIGAKLVWSDSSASGSTTPTLAGTPDGFRGRIDLGVRASMPGYAITAEGSYDGLGHSDWRSLGAMVGIRVPLQ